MLSVIAWGGTLQHAVSCSVKVLIDRAFQAHAAAER